MADSIPIDALLSRYPGRPTDESVAGEVWGISCSRPGWLTILRLGESFVECCWTGQHDPLPSSDELHRGSRGEPGRFLALED